MADHHLRVMTWNVWWRFGPRWQDRQPGLLATIERFAPDVVALQEVWSTPHESQADRVRPGPRLPRRVRTTVLSGGSGFRPANRTTRASNSGWRY